MHFDPKALHIMPSPRFSIITVARNDAWSMQKTMRSVFQQSFRDFEYIVVDGASTDGSRSLIEFWRHQGLVARSVSEPDSGVYDAMNKGLAMAEGTFVCFMNASDVFADEDVLTRVDAALSEDPDSDGVLGWGELNGQIWASWIAHPAFKMASLGFCHQALYVRRACLADTPFDARPGRTDSDTLQIGRLLERGARIGILSEVLAIRGGEPGLSADLERTARSITTTLSEEYPELTASNIEAILAFRRRCEAPAAILRLLEHPDPDISGHLARMVLDTLFQRQSGALDAEPQARLLDTALSVLDGEGALAEVERLITAQDRRAALLEEARQADRALYGKIDAFAREEERRLEKLRASAIPTPALLRPPPGTGPVVSMTSFPARLKTVSFVVTSLFEQTRPPAEIHLWLGRDEVPKRSYLPRRLSELESRGLRVHFADRTRHHYDKFLHAAEWNANRPYIIVDDDVIYPPTALEHLLAGHRRYPGAVIGNRCHRIEPGPDGGLAPYRDWTREVRAAGPSHRLLATGAGGVLYPPGFLDEPTVTRIEDILGRAPYADDLWLKACALARDIPVYATDLSKGSDWYHRYTPTMMAGTLMKVNVERGLNDTQIERCAQWLDGVRPGWRTDLFEPEHVF